MPAPLARAYADCPLSLAARINWSAMSLAFRMQVIYSRLATLSNVNAPDLRVGQRSAPHPPAASEDNGLSQNLGVDPFGAGCERYQSAPGAIRRLGHRSAAAALRAA